MPAEGVQTIPRAQILSFEEIARVVRVGVSLGLHKVRLTGGEPTVRADLPVLVRMLRSINGVREISMTTNGARLAELAGPLKDAGLDRVNISLDSLSRDRAAELARRDVLPQVLAGIEAAASAGLTPLKLNAVVIRGVNDHELADLVAFAHSHRAEMRFIEYMPMGDARLDPHNGQTVPAGEMLDRLREDGYDLAREEAGDPHDPARGWVCRRTDVDVRQVLRGGGTDKQVAEAFRQAAELKWAGHRMTELVPLFSRREMVAIGG
jgi:cyclic pyranopterin phosphate synthase